MLGRKYLLGEPCDDQRGSCADASIGVTKHSPSFSNHLHEPCWTLCITLAENGDAEQHVANPALPSLNERRHWGNVHNMERIFLLRKQYIQCQTSRGCRHRTYLKMADGLGDTDLEFSVLTMGPSMERPSVLMVGHDVCQGLNLIRGRLWRGVCGEYLASVEKLSHLLTFCTRSRIKEFNPGSR
jgi:hypothetical protein